MTTVWWTIHRTGRELRWTLKAVCNVEEYRRGGTHVAWERRGILPALGADTERQALIRGLEDVLAQLRNVERRHDAGGKPVHPRP